MTEQTSAGLRFRQALEVEKPLQIIGTVNAYAAMMAKQAGYKAIYVSGAGVRLNVGIFSVIDLAETVDRKLLDLVDDLAAAIVPLARVALRVLVGAYGPHRLKHVVAYVVF
jgi:2-methylisocitrate lyase-like PEP mutase family enzyme